MSDSADIELETLREAVERAVTSLDTGFAAVMRQHLVQHRGDNFTIYGPALTCMALGTGLGKEAALHPATALTLLIEAGHVFLELDDSQGSRLTPEWGMPRTLNAGDGFLALARDLLERAARSLQAERAAAAAAAFEAGARAFAEALASSSSSPLGVRLERAGASLYPTAAALAGIFGGADTKTMRIFERFGAEAAAGIAGMSDADFAGPRVQLKLNQASSQIIRLGDSQ